MPQKIIPENPIPQQALTIFFIAPRITQPASTKMAELC